MNDISLIREIKIIDLLEEIIDQVMYSYREGKGLNDIQHIFSKWPSNWPNYCTRDEEVKIRERLEKYKEEFSLIFSDPYYAEAYATFPKKVLEKLYQFFVIALNTKRIRKTRKRKVTNIKATKVFKFNSNGDPEYKNLPFLTNPDKIIGAAAVLVWIPKRRFAVWIEAKDRAGLAISKNNIVRFDPERSFAKVVRKPDDLINHLNDSKVKFKEYLKSIKTQEYNIDGKMNKKYVIVKVW